MKQLFIDTETTGTDPQVHGLIQIAGSVRIDGEVKERFDIKARPNLGKDVEAEALKVNGRTFEEIMAWPDSKTMYDTFVGILGKYVDKFNRSDKFHLLGYNVRFDEEFVRQLFRDHGDVYWGSWVFYPPIDVMALAADRLMNVREKMDNFKLVTVAARLGLDVSGKLHDAAYDIEVTEKMFDFLHRDEK